MGFTSFRGFGFISFLVLPSPPGYFGISFCTNSRVMQLFVGSVKFPTYSPCSFWAQRINQFFATSWCRGFKSDRKPHGWP